MYQTQDMFSNQLQRAMLDPNQQSFVEVLYRELIASASVNRLFKGNSTPSSGYRQPG